MLRDLKSLAKKLVDVVKNTIPAIAEAMEAARQKMVIFRYHFLHIKSKKTRINHTLQDIRPDIRRYEDIVMQLKAKIRERRVLLEEKKTTPALQIFRHRELAQRIAGLTKAIGELKNEKAMVLNQFNCTDDHGMTVVKQRVASMESSLKKLDQQEEKYTAELNAALAQYTELRQRVADMDTMGLETARQAIRHRKGHEATQRLQATYQKKFDSRLLAQSQKDVADLLDEVAEPVSIRQKLQELYKQHGKQYDAKNWKHER